MRDGAVATLRWHVVCGRVLHERLLTCHLAGSYLWMGHRNPSLEGRRRPRFSSSLGLRLCRRLCSYGALFQNADARHFLFNDVALLTGMTLNHKKYFSVQCGAEECAVLLERIATSCPEFRDM